MLGVCNKYQVVVNFVLSVYNNSKFALQSLSHKLSFCTCRHPVYVIGNGSFEIHQYSDSPIHVCYAYNGMIFGKCKRLAETHIVGAFWKRKYCAWLLSPPYVRLDLTIQRKQNSSPPMARIVSVDWMVLYAVGVMLGTFFFFFKTWLLTSVYFHRMCNL